MPHTQHDTHRTETTPTPPGRDRWEPLRHAWRWSREQVAQTYCWARSQPPERLATLAAGTVAVVAAVSLLLWGVVSLIGWFVSSDDPAPPASEPADQPPGPLEIAVGDTATYLADLVRQYATAHQFGQIEPAMIPALWLLIGAGLLLVLRSLPGVLLYPAWAAASVWTLYTATPDGNPVPAALAAGTLALAACAWWLVSGFLQSSWYALTRL